MSSPEQRNGAPVDGSKLLIIGVAGGTGSGKTTIARALLERLKAAKVHAEMMTMDSYYRELHSLSIEERARTNFDHPSAFELDLLIQHVKELRQGHAIEVPVYDFSLHQRLPKTDHMEPPQVLILEGILLFVELKLRELIDIKLFVEASADIRFIRRLKRDVVERGRTVDQVCSQYVETVRKMHDQFVEPSKQDANIILSNANDGDYKVVVDLLAARAMVLSASVSSHQQQDSPNKKIKT